VQFQLYSGILIQNCKYSNPTFICWGDSLEFEFQQVSSERKQETPGQAAIPQWLHDDEFTHFNIQCLHTKAATAEQQHQQQQQPVLWSLLRTNRVSRY